MEEETEIRKEMEEEEDTKETGEKIKQEVEEEEEQKLKGNGEMKTEVKQEKKMKKEIGGGGTEKGNWREDEGSRGGRRGKELGPCVQSRWV